MELEGKISDFLKTDDDNFICFTGRDYLKQLKPHRQDKALFVLSTIINILGERSATAQKLKQIITSTTKFFGTDQRIYIKVQDNKALGFVKVGEKKLFYRDYVKVNLKQVGSIKQLSPTSVLDIYVHESCQRSGIGKEVFEKFLKTENKTPEKLAYDRPSEKLISFLKKHYNLSSFIPQNNNFVIFDRFFGKNEKVFGNESHNKTFSLGQKSEGNNIKQKVEQNDSLSKLTSELKNMTFVPVTSTKAIRNQAVSSFDFQQWPVQEKINFRTTSNTYGSHYKKR